MTREEITEAFEEAGWKVTERDDESSVVGDAGEYSIIAHESVFGTDDPVFEVRDRGKSERGRVVYVREVPLPARAEEFLDRFGVSPEEADWSRKEPMVPESEL